MSFEDLENYFLHTGGFLVVWKNTTDIGNFIETTEDGSKFAVQCLRIIARIPLKVEDFWYQSLESA